jgi:hypothetical protein
MLKRFVTIWLAALFLVACEPDATPLPVDVVPTTSPATVAPSPQTVRYAIDPAALLVMPPDDYDMIAADAEVTTVSPPFDPAALGTQHDVQIALGDLPDGEHAASPVMVSLAINTTIPPLDDPEIAVIVRDAVDTEQFAAALNLPGAEALPHEAQPAQALRNGLANIGLPDGFDLSLTALFAPGADALQNQLGAVGITTQVSEIEPGNSADLSRSHLILFTGSVETLATDEEVYDLIALAAVPIGYRVASGLTVEFTPAGLPLVRR